MARPIAFATILFASLALVACGNGGNGGNGGDERSPGTVVDYGAPPAIFDEISDGDPFCTAAVLDGDSVVYAEAFGSNADGQVSTETAVDIASVSKQFTGVAIEKLIDQGDLTGSDDVAELVPASSPGTEGITVDELLTHTSGLEDYGDLLPQELDEPATQADAIAAISTSAPTGTRGRFEYSNSNYVLLAEVVASVTGTTLTEFLEDEVFGPLDLDMALDPPGPWLQIGDGSIWTTPTELVTWSTQYWDQTLEGPDLRSTMFDPEVETGEDSEVDGERYGSGILRGTSDDGAEILYHDGSWEGYETDWMVIPEERLAAAVTCNESAELATDAPAAALIEWRRP